MATTKAHDLARLLADGVVGTSEIGDDQVTTAKIPDNAVTTAKIANDAVTADKINIASSDVPYDNTVSGLSANTVKEAIDALNAISGGGNAGAQATFSRQKFTATAGQTNFTITGGYDVGYILVFMNGVLLDQTDFTGSDGSTVSLSTGARAGDEIVVIKLDSFAIAELLRVTNISASAPDDSLVLDAQGDLGLGTSTPTGIANSRAFEIKNTNTGTGTHAQVTLTGSNGHVNLLLASGDDTGGGDPVIASTGGHDIRFGTADNALFTNYSNKMTIGNNGHVAIGMPSAPSVFSVRGAGSEGTLRVIPQTANSEASIGFYQDTLGTDYTSRWVAGCGGWGQPGHFVVGNNNTYKMRITTAGQVTKPYQPYFLANNYGQVKASGWQQVVFTTYVEQNVGGHYSASNSRFTAPVAGVYVFSVGGYIGSNNNAERYAFCFRVNANSGGSSYISGGTQASVDAPMGTHTQAIKLNANDYVTVTMFTPNAETLGANYHRMWFNGYLLG